MARALITGIGGQDGSYLAELLVGKGYEVVGLVRRDPDEVLPGLEAVANRVELVRGDLLDTASLRRAVAEVRPDELYHLAAPTFVPASWADPTSTIAAIAGATSTLLAAVLEVDPSIRVHVATSSEIFGDSGESPQNEDSPCRPRAPYGVAKLAAHGMVRVLRAHHGLFACSGITFNHESPRRPDHFLPRKVTRGVAAIKLGQADHIELGSMDAVRDWCHARDVVRGAWMALQHDQPGDYVFCSGIGRTVGDLVDTAFAQVGLDPADFVRVNPDFVRAPEATAPVGDPTRAREVLGWEAETTFEETIAEMVAADLTALGG
ncbi:MAG: GDP-mannose 4,6-dehydratase [Solirubrobacteraceae bacterium]|nr:GDP-mannose 4,6-dehydratase [Solirubrobacteraceae bacterium]